MKIRKWIQLFFFIFIGLVAVNHTLAGSGIIIPFIPQVSLHGICPFGGVVSLYELFTAGSLIQKVQISSIVIMVLVFVLAILMGPVFCGWICPLGTFQEWTGKIGRKIFKKRYNNFVPEKADKSLRYVRYGVLAWVVYVTASSARLVFQTIDPYYALFNFWTGEVAAQALVVLSLTILASLFIERPWCKYLCPYGALLGLTNKIRIFKLRRDPSTCISCKACDRVCPMNIKVSEQEIVSDHQCISCMKCTSELSCPVKDTVFFATGRGQSNEN